MSVEGTAIDKLELRTHTGLVGVDDWFKGYFAEKNFQTF